MQSSLVLYKYIKFSNIFLHVVVVSTNKNSLISLVSLHYQEIDE